VDKAEVLNRPKSRTELYRYLNDTTHAELFHRKALAWDRRNEADTSAADRFEHAKWERDDGF
jgi:hypothetical protein